MREYRPLGAFLRPNAIIINTTKQSPQILQSLSNTTNQLLCCLDAAALATLSLPLLNHQKLAIFVAHSTEEI